MTTPATVVDGITSDDGDENEDDKDGKTLDDVFFRAARDIMNRVRQKVGMAARDDHRFQEHFGMPFEIVRMVCDMLAEVCLLPKKSKPKHLLWALYFLKCYPKEGPGCAAVGGSKGAIDPKTMQKWVWLFIECINDLVDEVVSLFLTLRPRQTYSYPPPFCHLLHRR